MCILQEGIGIAGLFPPNQKMGLVGGQSGCLVAAIEAKSHVGPSFGNNFNNRTEEAMGTAIDVWTAFREGALSSTFVPWIGYLFLLEDSEKSRIPIRTYEPHFKVLPEFSSASYATRYEVFLRKLVRERHYTATAFLLSDREKGLDGAYSEPANDLNFENFARSLTAHVAAYKA